MSLAATKDLIDYTNAYLKHLDENPPTPPPKPIVFKLLTPIHEYVKPYLAMLEAMNEEWGQPGAFEKRRAEAREQTLRERQAREIAMGIKPITVSERNIPR